MVYVEPIHLMRVHDRDRVADVPVRGELERIPLAVVRLEQFRIAEILELLPTPREELGAKQCGSDDDRSGQTRHASLVEADDAGIALREQIALKRFSRRIHNKQ